MDDLAHIFSSSRDAIGVSQAGTHVLVNPAYVSLFGFDDAGELVGRSILDLIAPSARDTVIAHMRPRSAGEPAPALYETRGLRRDGSEFDLEVYASSYAVDGVVHTVVTLRDVTARNAEARAMRESEERLRELTDQTLMGITIIQGGRIRFVNRRMAEILEWTVDEMLAWDAIDFGALIHPDDVEQVTRELARKMAGQSLESHYVYRAITRTGKTKWLELYSRTITFDGSPAVLISQLDVSARRDAEAEREALAEALRQAQKMEAVGQLAGGIAHDFNNLLTILIGNLTLAMADVAPGAILEMTLGDSLTAAKRAAALTSQLLAFSRKQVITRRELDANGVVAASERLLRSLVGANVRLVTRLAIGQPTIRADAAQLQEVLTNLVLNARDAIVGTGTVVMETETVTADEREARNLALAAAGTYVRISVEDDGCGMPPEVRARMFEPFFTTKPKGRGTGLGLAMVFGAVAQNGGTIGVRSSPGSGTRIDLYFPATSPPSERPDRGGPVTPRGSGERVLLVEDEPTVRKLTERIVVELGYVVDAYPDGETALAALAAGAPRPALLLTDVMLGGMNGRELAAQLPDVPVVYMSGYPSDVVGPAGALEPGIRFVAKPFLPEDLAQKLDEAARARRRR